MSSDLMPRFLPVPGPGFIAGCTVTSWLDVHSSAGPIAYLLIGHLPPRRPGETAEHIEASLLGMADAMRLRPAAERVPDIGPRLVMRGPYVSLDYGHPAYFMRIPTPPAEWRTHLAHGGPACLTIGLDPMAPGAGPDALGAYIARITVTGRAYMGATGLRNR
ncbi:hypothetical protein ACPCJU_17065 [Streptomyces thermodiastaticus]